MKELCLRTHQTAMQVQALRCAIRTIPRGRPLRIGSIYETISSMCMVNHQIRSTISSHTSMARPDDVGTRKSDTENCTSTLRSFDLSVIPSYFPEYHSAFRRASVLDVRQAARCPPIDSMGSAPAISPPAVLAPLATPARPAASSPRLYRPGPLSRSHARVPQSFPS